ncbi:MAG: RNA methyltransferase, partial [Bacteroidetes bacterium]|nr:RNA methyltransferase [Bacteroidota bacterium]
MTLSKLQIKSITNLRLKKYRNLENKFLVEGEKAVRDGLSSGYDYELILATQEYLDKNPHTLKGNQKAEIIKNNDFQKIIDTVNPQGIAAIFKKPGQKKDWTNNLNSELIVCLENVSDPGNVGTIIRNCDWFGIKDIILSNTCADVYNPKTIRSSVGSLFHANIFFS